MALDKMSKQKYSTMKEVEQIARPALDADFDEDDEEIPLKRKTVRNLLDEDDI